MGCWDCYGCNVVGDLVIGVLLLIDDIWYYGGIVVDIGWLIVYGWGGRCFVFKNVFFVIEVCSVVVYVVLFCVFIL